MRRKSLLLRAAPFAAIFALLAACSNQGEGERCSTLSSNGGNDDCQDGLICYSHSDLGTNTGSDLCCPPDRTQARTPLCALPQAPLLNDSGIPDGGADSSSDSPAEGSPDAPSEASESGTDAGGG